jgi:hypothetical protein
LSVRNGRVSTQCPALAGLLASWLRKIDTLLEDEAVIDVVAQALEVRWPQSRRRGRPGSLKKERFKKQIYKNRAGALRAAEASHRD